MVSIRGISFPTFAFISFILNPGVFAQSLTSSSSSPTSISSSSETHVVAVGADGLTFTPSSLTASPGDTVSFHFYPQNHSVARAAYKYPCIPYEDTGINLSGFWSGFKPVAVVLSSPPTFDLLINDTNPIFYYCSSPGACMNGMVGVINPNATNTFDTQLAYAKNSTVGFSPGEYFPAETSAATSSATTTSSPTSTSSVTNSGSEAKKGGGISTAAIVGIAVGGSVSLLLAGLVFYLCGRQKTMREYIRNTPSSFPANNQGHHNPSDPMMEARYPNSSPVNKSHAVITPPISSPYPASTRTTGTESMFSPLSVNPAWGMGTNSGYQLPEQYYRDHNVSPPPPGYTSSAQEAYGYGAPLSGGPQREVVIVDGVEDQVHELAASSSSPMRSSMVGEREDLHRSFSFAEGNEGYVQQPLSPMGKGMPR